MTKPLNAILDVVAVVSNPVRYESRYKLYKKYEKHMLDAGVRLTTVELAFGKRDFEITDRDNPLHIQLRTNHELWHKENLINIGISRLPRGWEYVAWIDTDIIFNNPDWVQETLHQLQHYHIVQMWSQAIDMCPKYHPARPAYDRVSFSSWVYCHCNGIPPRGNNLDAYTVVDGTYWHPGFAWAARRETIDRLGGLIDFAVLGSADHHMACALTGTPGVSGWMTDSYKAMYNVWAERADSFDGNVGYVDGMISHGWHGRKKDRGYKDRWRILRDHKFDPVTDLIHDSRGVLQFTNKKPKLRDDVRTYFRARNEDSIDMV